MRSIRSGPQTALVMQVVKAATPASGKIRMITMAEVEKHATKESVWFVRSGKVSLRRQAVRSGLNTRHDRTALTLAETVAQGKVNVCTLLTVLDFPGAVMLYYEV